MSLEEAVARFAADAPTDGDWELLQQACSESASITGRSYRASQEQIEDLAADVLLAFVDRVACKGAPSNPRAYLFRMCTNKLHSTSRKHSKRNRAKESLEEHVRQLGHRDDGEGLDLARGMLDQVDALAAEARGARKPRYQAGFEKRWQEVRAIWLGETSLYEILAGEGLAEGSEDFKKAANAAYKAHERVRRDLFAGVVRWLETERCSPEEARALQTTLKHMVHCQKSRPSASKQAQEES